MSSDRSTPDGRRIDVTALPATVVEFIDALVPGDDLIITRDGDAIATICRTPPAHSTPPGTRTAATAPPPQEYDRVTVVATAMKLSAAARRSLSAELGADVIVLDMHAAPATADVVLAPPASPMLIAKLRSAFPKAHVVVAEIEDSELGVSYRGPVRRMLDAGAETYLSSTTIPRLAAQLGHTIVERNQIAGAAAGRLEIEPSTGPALPPGEPAAP